MAGNSQLSPDVTKLFKIEMTDLPMRKLLQDIILRLNTAETKIAELEGRVKQLGG